MELKIKEKTLSVRHFVNKRVNTYIDEDGKEKYPLYTQVIYDLKNTKFRTFDKELYHYGCDEKCENDISEGKPGAIPPKVLEADAELFKIIQYEINRHGKNFKLRGLGDRLSIYWSPVSEVLSDQFRATLLDSMGYIFHYNDFVNIVEPDKKKTKDLNLIIGDANKKKPNFIQLLSPEIQALALILLGIIWFEETFLKLNCYDWIINSGYKVFSSKIYDFFQEEGFEINDEIRMQIDNNIKAIDMLLMHALGY